jgi:thioredoxin-related protein
MITRRGMMIAAATGLAAVKARPVLAQASAQAPVLTDDGLYIQPWFVESFLELGDDLETARKAGKRFAVMWELRGCPYCKETHLVNFAQPRISDYVRANFDILQLNIIGSRKVTDFDGTQLSEKALAAKYGVRYTPTLQFFGEAAETLKPLEPAKREVARGAGFLQPDDFLALFRFVREKAYEAGSFRDYLKARR